MPSPIRSKVPKAFLLPIVSLSLVLLLFLVLGDIDRYSDVALAAPLDPAIVSATSFPTDTHETAVRLEMRGIYTGSGSEIGAYHPGTQRLFNVTGGPEMEVLDLSDPLSPTLAFTVAVGMGGANSVAIYDDMVAVAVANEQITLTGQVHFYNVMGTLVNTVTVGALPDMLTFTPDGNQVVVANEGEPDDDYVVDPEGSVSVIDVSGGMAAVTQGDVISVTFTEFNAGGSMDLPDDVRIFGPGATVAQDLEPEYVAVSADSTTAWVTLQENNALAVIDLTTPEVITITALGFKDYSLPGNQLDPSDKDDGINIDNWPVYGMFQPDAIAAYQAGGSTYLLTANEGDARDYDGFTEEFRVHDLTLDAMAFTMPTATLQDDANLGRLRITDQLGDIDTDNAYEALYAYGARSFSIWDADGNQIFDSGDQFEHIVAGLAPDLFNANDSSVSEFDKRSDDKGAEPEGITQGTVNGRTYAFIGLERNGGIMVYDVTEPTAPYFVQYLPPSHGNVAPEGLLFLPASDTPTGTPWLVVNYEDSSTTAIFEIVTVPAARRLGSCSGSGSEIGAYHVGTQRLFNVTGGPEMEVLDLSDPTAPTLAFTVAVGEGGANSVAIHDDAVAVAVENTDPQADGFVHFYDLDGTLVNTVTVGALPDMLTFTPDGNQVVVANEGEPDDDYVVDPEGSVSVIDVSGGMAAVTQGDVISVTFTEFNAGGSMDLPDDVRIFGPGATVAQDLEPEYVAVSADSTTAWVTLQENNALAVIDLTTPEVITITALGFKDYSLPGNQLDPSNDDDGINIDNWPVYGMFQPDAIAAYQAGGSTYLLTANEGDARDYDGFTEEFRVHDLTLDAMAFTMPTATLQDDANLGRLRVTDQLGDPDEDDAYEELYAYGARSFSIWDGDGNRVFDSGDQLGHLTAVFAPDSFNSQGDAGSFDSRSDDKGTEPEGVTQGVVDGRTYAFTGLERIGGVMIYDVTDPDAPTFVQYLPPAGGDISPEGLTFIPAYQSPTRAALLVVNYEVSGSTTVYQLGEAYQVSLSEIRIDQPGGDDDEYFELTGTPNASLDGLTYLVIGDGDSGTIEEVTDLSGESLSATGFFVAAESTFSLGTADLTTDLGFENSDNVTHLLVEGFTGSSGDDLDTDNDGVLDVTPWTAIVDLIALVEEENPPSGTEYHYGPPSIGPDGSFVPGYALRCATWHIGSFDPVGGEDTPGAANDCPADVTAAKTGPDLARPGTTVTYTVSYANTGWGDAAAVVLEDALPADVYYVGDDSGLTCPACTMGATGTLTWTVGTMAPGDDVSFDLTVWVTSTVPAMTTLTNTVTLTTTSGEVTTTNNIGEWGVYVSPIDLYVEKTGSDIAMSGGLVVYTITLENRGVVTALNTVLSDTLPLSTTFAGQSNDCGATTPALPGATGTITWSLGNVVSATTCTFQVTAAVDAGVASGTVLVNQVEAATDTPADDPGNNTAQWSTTAYPLVTIREIQEVPDPANDDDSPLEDDYVWIEGVVIAASDIYPSANNRYFIEDPAGGPWSGLYIYNGGAHPPVAEGDAVRLFGQVEEYNGVTQLSIGWWDDGIQQVLSSGNPLPAPEVITTGAYGSDAAATAEAYESVLIEFQDATVTDDDLGYGEWAFDDGTGEAYADDWSQHLTYTPADGDVYLYIRGIGNYSFGDYKLVPRYDADVALKADAPTIEKDAPALVAPGERFIYTITVENDLGITLNNVVITDAVPANATFAYPLDGGAGSGGVVSWTVGTLPSPGSVSVRFAVTATSSLTYIFNADYQVTADNFVTPTQGAPLGTLVSSDVSLQIHDIQGTAHASALARQDVAGIHGIVTAIRTSFPQGFYMQDPSPDGDVATSEAIFVYTGSSPSVSEGDEVLVDGSVSEFRYDEAHLSMTRIEGPTVVVSTTGNALPTPIVLGNGGRVPPDQVIDDDVNGTVETSGTFDATSDGIDFYESLEAMLVQVNGPIAVSGTSYGTIAVVGDDGAYAGDFTPRGGLVVQPGDYNPERIIVSEGLESVPTIDTGVAFNGPITGVIDYDDYNGNFNLLHIEPLPVATGGVVSETTTTAGEDTLRVATFNVYNLDPGDSAARFDGLAAQIVINMGAPDIIGLQEIQDNNGTIDDGTVDASQTYAALIQAIEDAGGPTYDYRDIAPENNQDGGVPGGNIRVGFLFRTDRGVSFVDRPGGDATTAVTATLGSGGVELSASPGRIDPTDPAFDEGRKSLVGEFTYNGHTLFVVVNHLKSKSQDTGLFGRYQPPVLNTEAQRLAQAQAVNGFVDHVLSLDPEANVIVLGDLNDFQFSPPLQTLEGDDLTNLAYTVPITEHYTYIYNGNSQALDHILVSDNELYNAVTGFDIVHVNAEFGYFSARPSDHDPVITDLYLPAVQDLTGSTKSSSASAAVQPGDLITYTVTLSNTGGVDATVMVTDTLVAHYTVNDALDFTESPSNTLTWTGVVTAVDTVELQFVAQVVDLGDLPGGMISLTNTVWVNDGGTVIQLTDPAPPFVAVETLYLPIIARNYAP